MPDSTYNLNGGFKLTMKRFADLDGPDFFPTPRWATFALIDNEKFSGNIWECACGDGTMSKVLEETGCTMLNSDLHDRGYGEIGLDFLTSTRYADNIVTNPPYNCAEDFVGSGVKPQYDPLRVSAASEREPRSFVRGIDARSAETIDAIVT